MLPLVKSVRIERDWPQSVRITVEERQPWGIWQVGDRQYVIDRDGIVLADVPPAEGAPVVKDLTNPVRLVPGDRVDRDAVTLTLLLSQRVPEVLAMTPVGFEYSSEQGSGTAGRRGLPGCHRRQPEHRLQACGLEADRGDAGAGRHVRACAGPALRRTAVVPVIGRRR